MMGYFVGTLESVTRDDVTGITTVTVRHGEHTAQYSCTGKERFEILRNRVGELVYVSQGGVVRFVGEAWT